MLRAPDGAHIRTDKASIVDSLKLAGEELDELWTEAVDSGSEESVLIGEASQDVHRALIALMSA